MLGPYCYGTCWETCIPPVPVDITFHVDMSNEVVDGDVYMIGDFQTIPWQTFLFPTIMEDSDGDGVYSATVSVLSDDLIQYKFVNGSTIESDDGIGNCGNNLNSTCSSPGSDCNNREFQVPSCELNNNGDCILDALDAGTSIFNSCNVFFANANFMIDLNDWDYPNADYDQCGLNGSWNAEGDNWPGWGLNLLDEDGDGIFEGSLANLAPGNYEFIVFCSGAADNYSGWGQTLGAPLGSDCDFDSSDEYSNYGFTITEDDIDVELCAGSCEPVCSGDNGGGDDNESHVVTFDIDGLDECGFVSVTGTFDNWSGWGANNDTNMQASMTDGSYEFAILCVDTSIGEWYNDIWGSSTVYYAPLGSSCDFDPSDEFPNYGFVVNGSNLTVEYCAGSCESTCESGSDCNSVAGDVNLDGVINVVDVVAVVSHVLGNSILDSICEADLNSDGLINVVDVVALVNIILSE